MIGFDYLCVCSFSCHYSLCYLSINITLLTLSIEAPKTILSFIFSCEPVWSIYRPQRDFYQAHRDTSDEAQLALIKVFLLYMFRLVHTKK